MGRTSLVYFFFLIQIIPLTFVPAVHGADVATLVNQLPGSYSGQFQWRRSVRVYQVTFNFSRARELPTGQVEATGTGIYDEYGEISRVNIRAVIDPKNLYLEMWEYEQRSDPSAGMYRGEISTDMLSITAGWTNFLDKRRGELRLVANPDN